MPYSNVFRPYNDRYGIREPRIHAIGKFQKPFLSLTVPLIFERSEARSPSLNDHGSRPIKKFIFVHLWMPIRSSKANPPPMSNCDRIGVYPAHKRTDTLLVLWCFYLYHHHTVLHIVDDEVLSEQIDRNRPSNPPLLSCLPQYQFFHLSTIYSTQIETFVHWRSYPTFSHGQLNAMDLPTGRRK